MKNGKRIHKVVIKRMFDDSPDTSNLDEYSGHPTSGQFAIDRSHGEDCPEFFPNDCDEDDRCNGCASH